MNPRLTKLNEQRELILKHLQWIDEEIAAESPDELTPAPAPAVSPASALRQESSALPNPAPKVESRETAEIPVFLPDPVEEANVKSLKNGVRMGCLLYFGVACLLLAGVVALVYVVYP